MCHETPILLNIVAGYMTTPFATTIEHGMCHRSWLWKSMICATVLDSEYTEFSPCFTSLCYILFTKTYSTVFVINASRLANNRIFIHSRLVHLSYSFKIGFKKVIKTRYTMDDRRIKIYKIRHQNHRSRVYDTINSSYCPPWRRMVSEKVPQAQYILLDQTLKLNYWNHSQYLLLNIPDVEHWEYQDLEHWEYQGQGLDSTEWLGRGCS